MRSVQPLNQNISDKINVAEVMELQVLQNKYSCNCENMETNYECDEDPNWISSFSLKQIKTKVSTLQK